MRVTRLYLQNYRVYEEPVEIELPPGLVGVYGLNGAGKSTLLEAIRWALFGRARTGLEQVRTSGVKAECVAEVEFEHEGHLYVVRRSITGASAAVKAQAQADGHQVAEGARDTTRYLHSVLGMDDVAFRASVFAEQKQLAALSQRQPEERRKLVLQLLGITPVDGARDRARTEARDAAKHVERLRSVLPDLDTARARAAEQRVAAEEAVAAVVEVQRAATEVAAALVTREAAYDALDGRRQEHDVVASEAAAVQGELERSTARSARLHAELVDLERAAVRQEMLGPVAAGYEAAEVRFRGAQAVAAALDAVAAAVVPAEPEAFDADAVEAERAAAEAARTALAEVDALVRAATGERQRAVEALGRSAALSTDAECPLCGQALGDAFERVQAHRAADVAEVDARLAALTRDRAARAKEAERAVAAAKVSTRRVRDLQGAWSRFEQAKARRAEAERALAAARRLYPRDGATEQAPEQAAGQGGAELAAGVPSHAPVEPTELAALAAELRRCRAAADEVAQLRGRLLRRPSLEAELEAERMAAATNKGRFAALTEKLDTIAFDPNALATARAERDELRQRNVAAQRTADAARLRGVQAAAAAEAAVQRVADAEEQHARLAQQVDEARHLLRLSELLGAFRNSLVGTVGPRLSALAGDLFKELTDHEYDDLQVDPDTYEIRVFDRGEDYGMDRFSGSETDLANLALRVAISEHVQFQSGGSVGLLVLDEVFGPLDDDRKARMLQALQRLNGKFRQVLVVTHDSAIKEQLPNAIEVVKLPGRRAAVRPVA